jgi:hypothetical protein
MNHFKRSARRAMAKGLALSGLFLLASGAGKSQAQGCQKPVFKPFDATINAYGTSGIYSTRIDFLPSLLDSTNVSFSYIMTGATNASGSNTTGTGFRFNSGTTFVTVAATNSCGTTPLNFTVNVSERFYELGRYPSTAGPDQHVYYRTPYPASWHKADSMSRSINGNLVAINSVGEDFFVSRAVPDTMRAWIGLNKESGEWKWSNGKDGFKMYDPQYFQNWCPGQPDNWRGGQDYALIHSKGVAVGTDACWDDAHDSKVPDTNLVNNYYGVVETVPTTCNNSIELKAAASAVPIGTLERIFLGYGPQSDTLTAVGTGIGNLFYSWSGNGISMLNCTKCANPEFAPTKSGNFALTVTVTDRTGCTASATKTISVTDIRERDANGALTGNIWVCHMASGKSSTENPTSTSGHMGHVISHQDSLGKCGQALGTTSRVVLGGNQQEATDVQVYPNPTQNAFYVEVPQIEETATVTVMDIQGKVLETRSIGANDNRKVRFDLSTKPYGMYLVDVLYGDQRYHAKIVRQ